MKEMMYVTTKRLTILSQGEIDGYRYAILSLGTHPVAYVEIPKDHPAYRKHYNDIEIEVHGGLTYSGNAHWKEDDGSFWIGWDYAHAFDYNSGLYAINHDGAKKWTTSEIYNEVVSVIDQLEKLRGGDDSDNQ